MPGVIALCFIGLSVIGSPAYAQSPCTQGDDPLCPLAWLEGDWRGYGLFASDTTYIHKRFARDLRGTVLVERTFDIFPPDEPTTEYEVHEDFTVYHADGSVVRAKSFFVEGFSWRSVVRVSESGDSIVVETEGVENGPPGSRARITMVRAGPDAFTSVFELAFGSAPLAVYERSRFTRLH